MLSGQKISNTQVECIGTQNNIEKIILGGVLSVEKIPKVYLRL